MQNIFSLLAMVLAMTLYTTLHKLIGLYSVTSLGVFAFGIRAMKV